MQRLKLLLEAASAAVEILLCSGEVVLAPTEAKAEGQPSTRERIEARGLLCQHRGSAQRCQQHCRHQADTLGNRRSSSQHDKRLIVGVDKPIKSTGACKGAC